MFASCTNKSLNIKIYLTKSLKYPITYIGNAIFNKGNADGFRKT